MAGHPGYWQESDGTTLDPAEATRAWADQAPDVLREVAASYGGLIDYPAFAEALQSRSGVRTRMPVTTWIGPVLRTVMQELRAAGEPALTSLVVPKIDASVGGPMGHPSRLQAYAKYAGPLPAAAREALAGGSGTHGSSSGTTRATAASTRRAASTTGRTGTAAGAGGTSRASTRTPEPTPALCPRCFIALPATGVCDTCG